MATSGELPADAIPADAIPAEAPSSSKKPQSGGSLLVPFALGKRESKEPSRSNEENAEVRWDREIGAQNVRLLNAIFSNPSLQQLMSKARKSYNFNFKKWVTENIDLFPLTYVDGARDDDIVSVILAISKRNTWRARQADESNEEDPLDDSSAATARRAKERSGRSRQTNSSTPGLVPELIGCLRRLYSYEQQPSRGGEPSFKSSQQLQRLLYTLIREMLPPMECIEVLFTSRIFELHTQSIKIRLGAEFADYIQRNLSNVQELRTVLIVSGDGDVAEMSSCLDYCNRVWPQDGRAVLDCLVEALQDPVSSVTTFPSGTPLPSGTRLNAQYWKPGGELSFKVDGTMDNIIKIAQQLGWMAVVFRLPSSSGDHFTSKADSGDLFTSEAAPVNVPQQDGPPTFSFEPLSLTKYEINKKACWPPLLTKYVIAYQWPVRERNGEIGLEIPFAAMVQLARILGLISYEGGVVLKGTSSILYPVRPRKIASNEPSGQWHLIHLKKDFDFSPAQYATLRLLNKTSNRWLCNSKDLDTLSVARTFLGCYKNITIHLGTEDSFQQRIRPGATRDAQPKLELTGVSFGASLSKIAGLSANANFTLPKQVVISLGPPPYEQAIAYWCGRPAILYDTSDRRAWMVPVLTVIYHMVHTYLHKFRQLYPGPVHKLPYVRPTSDIGRETLLLLSEHSNQELYRTFDDQPYLLKEKVTEFCLLFDKIVAAKNPGKPNLSGPLVGWDFSEVVDSQFLRSKTPSETKFKGSWKALLHQYNIPLFFGSGFGNIIQPDLHWQTLCKTWRTVPSSKDYLTAPVRCLQTAEYSASDDLHFTEIVTGSTEYRSTIISGGEIIFDDCTHDDDKSCGLTSKQRTDFVILSSNSNFIDGALIFGNEQGSDNPLRKLKTLLPLRVHGQSKRLVKS